MLTYLLGEVVRSSSDGMYRFGIDEAIWWLGGDSDVVTQKVSEWIHGGPHLRSVALSFVNSNNWKVFTKRAKVVLDARPFDCEVARFLIGARRYPSSWAGSMEPYFQSHADAYRRWTRSRHERLRAVGAEAVAAYERLAAEAAAEERRERESF